MNVAASPPEVFLHLQPYILFFPLSLPLPSPRPHRRKKDRKLFQPYFPVTNVWVSRSRVLRHLPFLREIVLESLTFDVWSLKFDVSAHLSNSFISFIPKTKLGLSKVLENITTSISANIRLEDVFKTSWSRQIYSPYSCVFRRRFKMSSRRLGQDQYIRPGHTSSRHLQDVFKASYQDVFKTSSKPLQDVFKTSSKSLQDVLQKRLQDVLQRCLQDLFKKYDRVKLFLLTRFQDVFETYAKLFWDVVQIRLSTEGFA